MLFDQFIWTSQLEPPQVWLYAAPFAAVWVGPNFQAHLSPFSFPLASYHAFASDLRLDVGVEDHRAGCARVGPTGLEGSAAGRAAQVLRIDGPVAARAEPPRGNCSPGWVRQIHQTRELWGVRTLEVMRIGVLRPSADRFAVHSTA